MDKSDVFHQMCVAGRGFEGVIASTSVPFICCRSTGEGVPLHLAVLEWTAVPTHDPSSMREGWWLLRGEKGAGIFLAGFNTADAAQLADEFGIPTVAVELDSPAVRQEYFLSSPAWEGLRSWVERDMRGEVQPERHAARRAWWYTRAVRQLEVRKKIEAQTG
jgi:hypothetical protein